MTPLETIAEADRRWSRGGVSHDGKNLWPVLRIGLSARLEAEGFSSEDSGGGALKSLASSVRAALGCAPRLLAPRKWAAITDSLEAKPAADGALLLDRLLHPVAEKLGRSLRIVCEEGARPGCAKRYVYGPALPLEALKLLAEVLYRGWYLFRRIPFFAPSAAELATPENRRYLKRFLSYRAAWRLLFRAVRIERLIVNCYYGLGHQAAVAAAHDLGIWVDEVQHGLITPSHLSYNAGAPLDRYALPDRLLAFGGSALSANYLGGPEPIVLVGSWYLTSMGARGSSGDPDSQVGALRVRYDRVVVVSGQWSVQDELLAFLRAAAWLDAGIAYLYVPRSWNGLDASRFGGNLFLASDGSDVYRCMAECDVHATVYSTCALEALALGKPDVLIDLGGLAARYLGPVLTDGPYSRYVSDPAGLAAAAREAPTDPGEARRLGSRYFAPFDAERLGAVIKNPPEWRRSAWT